MPLFPWRRKPGPLSSHPIIKESRPLYETKRDITTSGISHSSPPSDIADARSQDQQHVAMRAFFGTHMFAPIQQPAHILDAGCGTGAWAEEMHALFPSAQITGMDISMPMGVIDQSQPAGYTFVHGNILDPLPFQEASFDYVHMRFLFSVVPVQLWPLVVGELVRVTSPGGWIELVEAYLPHDGGPALAQLEAWANQVFALRDVDASYAHHIAHFLREAGATNIELREEDLPIGPSGGNEGQMLAKMVIIAYRQGITAMRQALLLEEAQIEATLRAAELEIASDRYSVITPIYIACGQRV